MNIFNFIKSRVSIIDVVNEYATLKRAGLYWKGVCPFHHEKTASFTVSPHKDIFYCFGCHSGGDVIAFIQKAEQCSPLEAALHLAEHFKIDIPQEISHQPKDTASKTADQRKRYWLLCDIVTRWCSQHLAKNASVMQYLQNRNISPETIKKFNIGYFPAEMLAIKNLIEQLQANSLLLADLLETGIVAEGKNILYSPLADRIIFPIKDHMGRSCGFGGRIYKQSDERPKYYNSKENPHFSKGSLLFGFDIAKKSIQESGSVFLVEGYLDCITMVQHGFHNTVATLGTACTIEQLKHISRHAQELLVTYDSDQAGKKAMLRLTELCWQVNVDLKIIELPLGKDPDSFLNEQGQLVPLIEKANDIFVFFIEHVSQNFQEKSLQEKVEHIRALLDIINRIEDPLKQDILLQRAAKQLDIPLSSLNKERSRLSSKQNPNPGVVVAPPPQTVLKEITILEKKLFSVILNNVHLVKNEDKEYLQEYLAPPLQELLKKLWQIKGDMSEISFSLFFDTLTYDEKLLISHLVVECQEYEGPENLEYMLAQFQRKTWKSFVTDTKIKLQRLKQEHNNDEAEKILSHFQDLKEKLITRGLI
jgi:DNA primase